MSSLARRITQFSTKEVDQLFLTALRVVRNPELTILIAPALRAFGRILIITPKKVGTAPVRNLLRRRLKAIFYQERLYEQPYDCIVLFKKHVPPLSFDELKQILATAYLRAKSTGIEHNHC